MTQTSTVPETFRPAAPLRAATLGRQSKARDDDSAGSPTAQRLATTAFVAARGWVHVGHFEDVGASGYDPNADRPGLDAVLRAVRAGDVDVVVVYRLDRLTRRGVVEAVRLVGELAENGASLASVNEPFLDTSTPMGRGIFAIFAALAEQESANISMRTKSTKDVLKAAGSYPGGPRRYGYTLDKEFRDGLTLTVMRPEPTEAAIVADIVARVLDGASVTGEASRLNREGITTATGAEWSTSTVIRLLRSPVLAGYVTERVYKPGARVPGGAHDLVIVRDESGTPVQGWEPIVDPADWHRVQSVLDARGGGRGPRPNPTLLGGMDIFRCADCGGRMAGHRRTGNPGQGNYVCANRGRGSARCNGPAISMPHTEAYLAETVWSRLRDLDPSDPADLSLLRAVAARYSARTVDPETESARRAAQAVIDDAQTALAQLDDDRAAGVFAGPSGTERYRRQAAAILERDESARATLAALPRTTNGDDIGGLFDVLHELRHEGMTHDAPDSPWASWTMQERRDFLSLFLARVTVTKGGGREGGSHKVWKGYERIALVWADATPPF